MFATKIKHILYTMNFRIKELCKEKSILFKDLAAAVGVHDVTLRASLQGNPTIGTLEKVAAALGVEVVELFAKRGDFVAFVRRDGVTHTFDTEDALIGYAEGLKADKGCRG